ncbi:MAG: M66 family metalloprotease [Bacteroidota bacterium]
MRVRLVLLCYCLLISSVLYAQTSLGSIQPNTNNALPSSYNFQEYVFAEPNDQGNCQGATNATASIDEVFMAQTHRHAIGHPFFFTIGHRPALLQLAITGSGAAPDVQVEGFLNGNSLGSLCLAGPANLSSNIDLDTPNFDDYFSVTLPKSWIQNGLSLVLTAGNDSRSLSPAELKIGPKTELNLVMVNMDVLDYNEDPHYFPIFNDFLQELASALPVSELRFGTFPLTMPFPEFVVSNNTEQLVRLNSAAQIGPSGIPDEGYVNYVSSYFTANMQISTGDFPNTIYFGNTLNLAPGGWGGGSSFVSPDFTMVFIHELGHALSLPHWEGDFNVQNPSVYDFSYPYGGESNDGGGRGEAWNFIQDKYEFVSPFCEDEPNYFGFERSDCMQREYACLETRSYGPAEWDGFGDFSALAIHRYLIGADAVGGQVSYKDSLVNYHFNEQYGFPDVRLVNGQRVFSRDSLRADSDVPESSIRLPGQEQLEQEVYLIYGTAHRTQPQANIVYEPLKYNGTLLPVIDPTDPAMFATLQGLDFEDYPVLVYESRDITLKLRYADGSVLHALMPFNSFEREVDPNDYGLARLDVHNFVFVAPGDKELCQVEVYYRPFIIDEETYAIAGNINYAPNNITAANFMNDAVLLSQYSCNATLIDELPSEPQLQLYPNPFNESISLQMTEFEAYEYRIFNQLGQQITQAEIIASNTRIDTQEIPAGMYYIKVNHKTGTKGKTFKMIKP